MISVALQNEGCPDKISISENGFVNSPSMVSTKYYLAMEQLCIIDKI